MSQLNHPNPSPSSADVSKVPKKNDGADSSLQSSDKKDNLDKAKPHAIKSADDQQKGPSIEGVGPVLDWELSINRNISFI